jgi:hypothetical protein
MAIMQSNMSGAGNGAGERDHLLKSLTVNDRHFEALKLKAGTVRERLAAILQHESSLRRIAHEIRLSGVNAVIICAKLGEDGRALRELAHWLRELTDESDEIIPRLQTVLGECRDTLHTLTEEQVAGLETLLARFSQDAERLDRMIITASPQPIYPSRLAAPIRSSRISSSNSRKPGPPPRPSALVPRRSRCPQVRFRAIPRSGTLWRPCSASIQWKANAGCMPKPLRTSPIALSRKSKRKPPRQHHKQKRPHHLTRAIWTIFSSDLRS